MGLQVNSHRSSCLILPPRSRIGVATCSSVLSPALCSETGSQRVHIWKPFAFTKCLLFQPLTVIVMGVITDGVQGAAAAGNRHGEMYMHEGPGTKRKGIARTRVALPLLKCWFSHHIPKYESFKKKQPKAVFCFPNKNNNSPFFFCTFVGNSPTITHSQLPEIIPN